MAQLTLGQAAKQVGKSKSTLTRAIQKGKLSAHRQDDNSYGIDPSELFRVWPATGAQQGDDAPQGTPEATQGDTAAVLRMKVEMLEAQVERERDTVEDLRKRLDRAEERVFALSAPTAPSKHYDGAQRGFWGRVKGLWE